MANPIRNFSQRYPMLSFLLLTLLITWGCVVAVAAGTAGLLPFKPSMLWMAFVGQFGPAYAAIILAALASGRGGVGALLRSARRPRFGKGPWAVIVVVPPLAFFAAYLVHIVAGGEAIAFAATDWSQFAITLAAGSVIGLIFGGFSEEPGWRGWLLPRLQGRVSPLVASLVVGVIWSLWHLDPDVVAAGMTRGWGAFLAEWWQYQSAFLPRTVAFAILMTALYNRTGGNLFSMMAVHSVSNAFETAIPESWTGLGATMVASRVAVDYVLAFVLLALWRRHAAVVESGGPARPVATEGMRCADPSPTALTVA